MFNFINFKTYNFEIYNKKGIKNFYFSPNASVEGSIYHENMSQNYIRKNVKKTKVKIIKLTLQIMKKLNIPIKIDFVKIDVWGVDMGA